VKRIIPAAIAMGVGLIILVSYLVNNPVFFALRLVFIDWAVILAGLAVVAGGLNLLLVLARRVDQMALDWPCSLSSGACQSGYVCTGGGGGTDGPLQA
jgi:hypothetical protein